MRCLQAMHQAHAQCQGRCWGIVGQAAYTLAGRRTAGYASTRSRPSGATTKGSMFPVKLDRPLAILDIEATGISPRADRLVELAIVRLDPDGTEQARTWLVNPTIPIPVETTAIHGITDEVVKTCPPFAQVAEEIKRVAFKITRAGELIGRRCAAKLGVPFNIVDLSLAPTPAPGDSVGDILEAMGLDRVGGPGTTAALAMLNDAVKRGGAMATGHAGGMSGAFIPVSEDATIARRAAEGALTIEKLEAMTAVCSVGMDMVIVPGDTTAETLSGIIADEAAIGMINKQTTAGRIIPAPGTKVGDMVEFGGLLGRAPVMAVHNFSSEVFIGRGGRIPAPIQSLTN